MVLKINAPTLEKAKARLRKWQGADAVKKYTFKKGAKKQYKTKKGFYYVWHLIYKKKGKSGSKKKKK